jgi:hypothetical protein
LFQILSEFEVSWCARRGGASVSDEDNQEIRQRIGELILAHRDLDDAITHMATIPQADELQLRRMKKRKLLLKDVIGRLQSGLIPDLDA